MEQEGFNTTKAPQYSISFTESTQFLELAPMSLGSILIFSYHLRLGLSKGILPVSLPVNISKAG